MSNVYVNGDPEVVVPAEHSKGGTLFLSNIDQKLGFYVKKVLFFRAKDEPNSVVSQLKLGLSRVLVPYYFLAGRLQQNDKENRLEVDCNDAGVLFATATTDLSIAKVENTMLVGGALIDSDEFIFAPPNINSLSELPLLTVQITLFRCGGFSLGYSIIHALMDGTSHFQFLMNYMSVASKRDLLITPNPDRTMLMARVFPKPTFQHFELVKHTLGNSRFTSSTKECILAYKHMSSNQAARVCKSFLFNFKVLNKLKEHILKDARIAKCTNFEALAAHVWRAHAKCVATKPDQTLTLQFTVDFRTIIKAPLADDFCGNAIYIACTQLTYQELSDKPISFVVEQIQHAKSSLTSEYIRSAIDFSELNGGSYSLRRCDLKINSLPRIASKALYGDFGWGRAAFVGYGRDPMSSDISFYPLHPHFGEGLNVVVCLEQNLFSNFEELICLS